MANIGARDLRIILNYGEHPVRVGVINNEEVYCLHDLLTAIGQVHTNVTHKLVKIPPDVYYRATTIDLDGFACNNRVVAVTYEGACLILARLSKIDLYDVLQLLRWLKTVSKDKMNKGA